MSNQGPPWGATPSGFVRPPLALIRAQAVAAIQADMDDPTLDLSPQTVDGKMLDAMLAPLDQLWDVAGQAYNANQRSQVAGAGLDNLGDLTGSPRETATFTQVECTCGLNAANAPYAAGSLVAAVQGQPSQVYTNLYPVTAAQISGGSAVVLFQSIIAGAVPALGANTLQIAASVTGWTTIANGLPTQVGTNEETDATYEIRQAEELAAEGTCNAAALREAIMKLGAEQSPPVTLVVLVLENTSAFQQTIQGVVLPPKSFQVVIYEADGLGWIGGAGGPLIGEIIWENTPNGVSSYGPNPQQIIDPVLGVQTVYWASPTAQSLFVSATIVPAPTYTGTFAALKAEIQAALVAAAIAPLGADGNPPPGQLAPGTAVVGPQLTAVMMSVPGVFDVQGLTFGFSASPTNTAPLPLSTQQVATILASTVAVNVVLAEGNYATNP